MHFDSISHLSNYMCGTANYKLKHSKFWVFITVILQYLLFLCFSLKKEMLGRAFLV